MKKTTLTVLVCVLAVVLAVMLGAVILLGATKGNTPAPTTLPELSDTTPPDTSPTPTPTTTAPDTSVWTTPGETTPPETTPDPQPTHYTLSFAGDCTFANVQNTSGKGTFLTTVGDKYDYPFADVLEIFQGDDCTFVNLECVLSERGKAANKRFTFRGPPAYVNILTQGSVEYAGVVNNHTMDYGKDAYRDTLSNLDGAGIHYVEDKTTKIFTTESGLKIGVYAHNFPYETTGIKTAIQKLRADGAEIVVVNVHWGEEYYYKPNGTQQNIAHYAIDGGADIVWGTHPHVLQPIEHYKDGVIFYSLGNFSFGGNRNPADKDTAILQVDIVRELDGTVHMGEVNIIPCHVSGILSYGNDFQPVPMDENEDKAAWERVMKKLSGTYEKDRIPVNYPEPTDPEPTTPGESIPGGTTPEPTTPEPTTPQPTTPEPTTPELKPTEPEPTEPEPTEPEPTPAPEAPEPEPSAPSEAGA